MGVPQQRRRTVSVCVSGGGGGGGCLGGLEKSPSSPSLSRDGINIRNTEKAV